MTILKNRQMPSLNGQAIKLKEFISSIFTQTFSEKRVHIYMQSPSGKKYYSLRKARCRTIC